MKVRYQQYMSCYTSIVATPVGDLTVFASNEGVKAIDFADHTDANVNENDISALTAKQLNEYLKGLRQSFDVPLCADGTEFQHKVWQRLMEIGYGEVSTYLSIAKQVGNPLASRAIGLANGKNPIPIIVPCHRVIGSNGKLTGYASGLSRKSWLLDLEAKHSVSQAR